MDNTNHTSENKQKNTSAFSEVMVVGLFGSVIYILGIVLPYASLGVFEISLLDGGMASIAGLFLLIGVLGLASSVIKKPVIILIVGILAVALTVFEFLTFQNNSSGASLFGYSLSNMIHYGTGFYFLWLGAGVLMITGLYGLYRDQQKRKTSRS